MNEKLKDVILGISSLFVIIIVFYLYFNSMFGVYSILEVYDSSNIIEYEPKQHHSCDIFINEPTIVLRLDDVRAYSEESYLIIDETIKRNIPILLGVIPNNLNKDFNMINYLQSIRDNPLIEIAQHGYYHNLDDTDISEESLLNGMNIIIKYIGVKPRTYVPPYNTITESALNNVKKHFDIISSSRGVLKEGEIAEIGFTEETFDYSKNKAVPLNNLIKTCKKSLELVNLCVVEIHPQEYSEDNMNDYYILLDQLKRLKAKFSTFNEIVKCSD